ncbi:MAG: hypothetical protein J6334_00535, partial [Kiritimatiellae bacterium]|nr:hypothetical protein [Kiritimatiellia bacterium]
AITGDYFAFRLYNRPLSEAELEQNMKVDEIRFRGNTAPYRDVTVVNVQPEGAETEVQSSMPDGEYEVKGQWAFTAGTVMIGGRKYVPKYTLETWDGSEWVNPTTEFSGSYTHRAGATPVRITWEWTPYRGTLTILK